MEKLESKTSEKLLTALELVAAAALTLRKKTLKPPLDEKLIPSPANGPLRGSPS